MKIIHTSDWHIGRNLYNKKRYEEHYQFFTWLKNHIIEHKIDMLLVSGDIFDTGTPSNQAQELYYRFLCEIAQSQCKNIIITGGNHDSPSFLNAPREVLKNLNVRIFGAAEENIEDHIVVIDDQVIVCAVPYLRERDIRKADFGESDQDKLANSRTGIVNYYAEIVQQAKYIRDLKNQKMPIIVMGHLFTTGGKVIEGDGVRELYVGNLNRISAGNFSADIDYLALGHLHSAQIVGGREHFHYSGAPLKMSFSEANQKKYIIRIETDQNKIDKIEKIEVPAFQRLESLSGDMEIIEKGINQLIEQDEPVWLEVIYTGREMQGNLQQNVHELVEDTKLEILQIKNMNVYNHAMRKDKETPDLKSISEREVFEKCLQDNRVVPEEQELLTTLFNQVMEDVWDEE